jgi:ABC-2 type transport system permease protein
VRGLLAHLRLELALLFRNGESLLLTLGIPVLLLVFFSNIDVLPIDGEPIQFLAPGVLALAVLSTALVQTAIGTGFEREYGVLKRLGATPLGRPRLLAAKTLSILVVELVQGAVLWGVALACGWDPSVSAGRLAGAVVLGTVGCAALGLCLAGTLRALATLAAANGLYLVLLLLSGMVIPLDELPSAARAVARALPSGALAEAVRGSLTAGVDIPGRAWLVLAAWAVAAPLAATRLFRWE